VLFYVSFKANKVNCSEVSDVGFAKRLKVGDFFCGSGCEIFDFSEVCDVG
jgi:hypothetical protein